MNRSFLFIVVSFLFIGSILCAGCNSYAEPKVICNTTVNQVNASELNATITYDVSVEVTNTGLNNAYDVAIMVLLSTPKDLPEYRFVNENIDVGTVPKHETVTIDRRVTLPMTPDNYNLLFRGERKVETETKVTRISSNIMG
jgi:hypothetical protein